MEWLAKANAPATDELGEDLDRLPTMGCTYFQWEGQPVSLICFKTGDKQVIHLFVTPHGLDQPSNLAQHEGRKLLHNRETLSWHDNKNAYVLVAHDKGQILGRAGV